MTLKKLTQLEESIYNQGERLIPGVTHDLAQFIRHRSSYMFFRRVIENDLAFMREEFSPIRIVDLGCGVGHGCSTLADIQNSQITGVDISPESLKYARRYYTRRNITYQLANLIEFIATMPEYDYVTARNVLEHIPNGLILSREAKWRHRFLFDVPYNEPPGRNPHHFVHHIREDIFAQWPNTELFFQDMEGAIYDTDHKPPNTNIMVCVCSRPGLPRVAESIRFPVLAWQPGLRLRLKSLSVEQVKISGRLTLSKCYRLLKIFKG